MPASTRRSGVSHPGGLLTWLFSAESRANPGQPDANSRANSETSGQAPLEVLLSTVNVVPASGSWWVAQETPASMPSRKTALVVACRWMPRP